MNHSAPVIINVRESLPQTCWRAEQIRQMEQQLIAAHHTTLYHLMLRAGEALLHTLQHCWPNARHLWIFCGKGNNGGDGYVLAKMAKLAGYTIQLAAFDEPASGIPAEQARQDWIKAGGSCGTLQSLQGTPDVIVDALLGIGPSTQLRGDLLAWIQFINRQAAPVLAADIPSGLYTDTGVALGGAVHATVTLTFIALKVGLMTGVAADYIGELYLADLDSNKLNVEPNDGVPLLNYEAALPWLQPRARTAHKGDFGKILMAGGGVGMPGAIRLAGEAALRTGAGLVRVYCHPDNQQLVFAGRPELMMCQDLSGSALAWPDVLVVGPGLGVDDWAEMQWHQLMSYQNQMVVDADALNWLAQHAQSRNNWVLTPHPGEAARLLHTSIADIQADRFAAIQALQHRYGGVVLLKGAGSLVFDGKQMVICSEGNPGMASGGMGDILSGIIAALLAQGLTPFDAACCGALIHGKAANLVAINDGERGMLASDLFCWLHKLVNPQRYQHEKNADTKAC
jgi:hydroxyethylthiazole kinase-like uncharacterized protein yjeF